MRIDDWSSDVCSSDLGHDDVDHCHDQYHEHEHEEVPFVKLRSERFDIRSEYEDPLPGFEKVRFRLSFTDYEHDEIEHDEVATTFSNKAHELRFELAHKPIGPLRGAFGVQHSESQFSAVGEEAFLPESETRNKIGRASGRERVCTSVKLSVVAYLLK